MVRYDVDFDKGEITVRRNLLRPGWVHGCGNKCGNTPANCPERERKPKYGPPKGRKNRRRIPVPPSILTDLREHRRRQAQQRLAMGPEWKDSDPRVFTAPRGGQLDHRNDSRQWHVLLGKAGVEQARLHDARHTAAALQLLVGTDTRTTMSLMGWTQESMATRCRHAVDDLREQVAVRLEGPLFGPPATESDRERPGRR